MGGFIDSSTDMSNSHPPHVTYRIQSAKAESFISNHVVALIDLPVDLLLIESKLLGL
jgi:hypothetical protein